MRFVGIVHADLQGKQRLERLLQAEKPGIITIEAPAGFSLDDLAYKIMERRAASAEAAERAIEDSRLLPIVRAILANEGYEWLVVAEYCKSTGAKGYGVDDPELIYGFSTDAEKRVSSIALWFNDLLQDLPYDLQQFPRRWDEAIDKFYYGSIFNASMEKMELETVRQREAVMARGIKKKKPDLHVAGIAHVAPEYAKYKQSPPLYELLGLTKESLIRLCEV